MIKKYNFDSDPYNTHMLLLDEVPPYSKVLDVGTAGGFLGEYLIKEKNCELWGIEPDSELYQNALNVGYVKMFQKTIENVLESNDLLQDKFDVIFLGDVLEHLICPEKILAQLKFFLKVNGKFIISLPNIAHYSTRFGLLVGKFDMADAGILDRTHLHFYTRTSAIKMIEECGLEIEKIRPSGGNVERWMRRLFHLGRKIFFLFPNLFSWQFIFVAKIKDVSP